MAVRPRVAARTRWAFAVVVGLAMWAPALRHWRRTGFGDWQQFTHWWAVGIVSIRRWGEWPLWDPHHCGGITQWGQPQAQNFGPLYLLLALGFGTAVGQKLFLVVHTVIGWLGAYRFARRDALLLPVGAFLAATI